MIRAGLVNDVVEDLSAGSRERLRSSRRPWDFLVFVGEDGLPTAT
jgi:hypothetical protein